MNYTMKTTTHYKLRTELMRSLVLLLSILTFTGVAAATPDEKGFEIAARSDRSAAERSARGPWRQRGARRPRKRTERASFGDERAVQARSSGAEASFAPVAVWY